MRFYTENRKYYCGIDLHTKTMYVCILDETDSILLHKNIPAQPKPFLALIADYRDGLVVDFHNIKKAVITLHQKIRDVLCVY